MLKEFSREVCDQLKCYVYRLVDPRNGLTFYVGKGKENRIFSHLKCALKKSDLDEEEANADLKYGTIRNVQNAGLEVLHIIHRWGMDDHTAFEVESALIEVYSSLSNKVSGHHAERGCANVEELEGRISAKEFEETPQTPPFMIIKVNGNYVETLPGTYEEQLYEATRSCWKVSPQKVKEYPYVLSVVGGIVEEIFSVKEWVPAEGTEKRYAFIGSRCEDPVVREIFCKKKIPQKYRKKGMASPVLYSLI